MSHITPREKTVLIFTAIVLVAGSVIRFSFYCFPNTQEAVSLIDNGRLAPKIDINHATAEELIDLPFIGEYTARQIVAHRSRHGAFSTLDELKNIPGIKEKNFLRFAKYLRVSSSSIRRKDVE